MTVRRKFILLIECFAKRMYQGDRQGSQALKNGRYVEMELELPAGSLLEEIKENLSGEIFDKEDDLCTIYLKSLDYKEVYLSCLTSEVEELTTFETDVLFPVKPVSERLRLYMDDTWLDDADHMKVGDLVEVEIDDRSHMSHGILRYKGPVQEKASDGILFGIEIKGYKVEGGCDGSIGAKKYFNAAPKSGLFVPVSSVRSMRNPVDRHDSRDNSHFSDSLTHQGTTGSSSSKSKSSGKNKVSTSASVNPVDEIKDNSAEPPLSINDRVVWISDDGPEYGYVRWIGNLPDAGDDCMVGVEFDNPVGIGTGNYNDLQLFITAVNHAAIVPIMGLMKANDFGGSSLKPATPSVPVSNNVSHHGVQRSDRTYSRNVKQENHPSSMFVPHEDHPLSRNAFNTESSTTDTRPMPRVSEPRSMLTSTTRHTNHPTEQPTCCTCHCAWLWSPVKHKNHPFFFFNPFCRDFLQYKCLMHCAFGNQNHGSHNSVCMSRESLPYLPQQAASHLPSRNFDGGMPIMNDYVARNPVVTTSSLPGYETDAYNVVSDCASPRYATRGLPMYSSVNKPTTNRVASTGNIQTSSESTLMNQPRTNFSAHRTSNSHSTLPSYSSQTFYPTSGSDYTLNCVQNQDCSSNEISSNTMTTTGECNVNHPHSRASLRRNMQHRESALVSSCPEMDSGSFYHVVPDDCTNHMSLPDPKARLHVTTIDLKNNEDDQGVNHSINSYESYDRSELSNDDRYDDGPLEVGSVVEIIIKGEPKYGLIKWIGTIPEYQNGLKEIAGIELEEESPGCTDGTFNEYRLFDCPSKKGLFVQLNKCRKDRRFTESDSIIERPSSAEFGSMDCPVVSGDVPPLSQPEDIKTICGKYRGIQGHHNSCYLDATLFSMFSFSPVFDCILHRPSTSDDINQYVTVQQVIKEEIVNPLRRNLYVRADRVMKLRKLLDELSSVSGLTSEEKDPEEFLNSLLNQIMKAEPFLKLSSGQESYFYQLFVEKDDKVLLPTVQQLFDQSFLTSDIKLKEVPSCLLIQMPRFGKQFKMYPRIIPSPYLDITDILEDSPRQCSICGQVAEFECKECYRQFGEGLESTAFCTKCLDKSHCHQKRSKHKSTKLRIPDNFQALKDHTTIPRIFMELFAVVCIETSHYVAFVKCGTGPDAPWCFFDSMADRRGEQNGYNIPEVVPFKDLKWWLSEEGFNFLLSTKDDKNLPEMPKRLLCDAYMCFYQSPDVMMYR